MRILITGGTGSFGNAFALRVLGLRTLERLVILSRDELKQSVMAERLGDRKPLRFFLGDVRDRARLVEAFHGIDTVIHAAALKRIDAIAYNPDEVVKTNVNGTMNVVSAAIEAGVQKVVVISSDKAVAPANAYGASKLLAEFYAVQANAIGYPRGTKIAAVRYGNVLASRGAVIHVFRDAVAKGNPLRITDARMTRFWLTLGQAVDIVLHALDLMEGGEIFVPILPSMRITELATAIGGPGYPIELVGLRPGGEKLHEALLSDEEVTRTLTKIAPRPTSPELLLVQPTHRSWETRPWMGEPVDPSLVYRSDVNPWFVGLEELQALVERIA